MSTYPELISQWFSFCHFGCFLDLLELRYVRVHYGMLLCKSGSESLTGKPCYLHTTPFYHGRLRFFLSLVTEHFAFFDTLNILSIYPGSLLRGWARKSSLQHSTAQRCIALQSAAQTSRSFCGPFFHITYEIITQGNTSYTPLFNLIF